MTNSVDDDQMPCSAVSDVGLYGLLRPVCLKEINRAMSMAVDEALYLGKQLRSSSYYS